VPSIGQDSRFFNSYGSRPNEGRVNIDGLGVGQGYNGGGVGFSPDPSTAEEMQVTVAGGLGEQEVGSAMVNFVPKTGGNLSRARRSSARPASGRRQRISTTSCEASAFRRPD
jgi:hypothetical protein